MERVTARPIGVAALADQGDVRVKRRDGAPVLLVREDSVSSAADGALTAARALRSALAHLSAEDAGDTLTEEFPWADLLPESFRRRLRPSRSGVCGVGLVVSTGAGGRDLRGSGACRRVGPATRRRLRAGSGAGGILTLPAKRGGRMAPPCVSHRQRSCQPHAAASHSVRRSTPAPVRCARAADRPAATRSRFSAVPRTSGPSPATTPRRLRPARALPPAWVRRGSGWARRKPVPVARGLAASSTACQRAGYVLAMNEQVHQWVHGAAADGPAGRIGALAQLLAELCGGEPCWPVVRP